MKENDFDYINIRRKKRLEKRKIELFTLSKKGKVSVYDEIIREQAQIVVEDLESILRTMRIGQDDLNFILQQYSSNLVF